MKKKLALITPLYNTEKRFLDDLETNIAPFSAEVEWVLVNDSPQNKELKRILSHLDSSYIKVCTHEKNKGIFAAYTTGFMAASAMYCCIVDHDDIYDPEKVLKEIDKNPDLIYTDEYKFNDKKKYGYFKKPDFDILSTCFYFYTHHVTVMKTDIVQDILLKKGNSGHYTSLFDIHISLEYIGRFIGKPFNVLHIKSLDYGWRVHENSTALNLDQKLSGYFERMHKVEEFFMEQGDTPMLNIHKDIGYVVEGDFLSAYDMFQYPLNFDTFIEYFTKQHKLKAHEGYIYFDKNRYCRDEWYYFYRMLFKIPLNYLRAQKIYSLFIPDPDKREELSPENYKLHPPGVPFLVEIENTEIMKKNGMRIELDSSNMTPVSYGVIMK